jgi:phenylpropionate dioxygenase-like ring-hydroxylating dioxygenase large terminal subunit
VTDVIPTQTGRISDRQLADQESPDLRRVGIHPDFWYPVAVSASVPVGQTFAARFAGERIALYRSA